MKNPNSRRTFIKQAGIGLLISPALSLSKHVTQPLPTAISPGTLILDVREMGARGDGITKDTAVLQQAIDRCHILGGGTVRVPAGNYLTGAIQLRSGVTLLLEKDAIITGSADLADYRIMQVRWEGKWIQGYSGLIYAIDARNIAIKGSGKISGSDKVGGRPNADNPLRHPALIEPINCTDVHFEGFNTYYHIMWSIHLTYCENVTIKGLTIRSTGGNGDGIDVDSCKQVTITGCDISTGDDCISLKSGRGMEGYLLARATENVVIKDCTFADSIFACIGIGSETSGGIRNVVIENCRFTAAKTFALYIKSQVGRGAFIENISAKNLEVSGMMGGFLRFNLTGSGLKDQQSVPGLDGIPTTKNFSFTDITVTDVPVLVDGTSVHADKPLEGLTLKNIKGTCKKGIALANIRNADISNITVQCAAASLIATYNVDGKGLKGAATLPMPNSPAVIPPPAIKYELK